MVLGRIARGRHIDNQGGRHSIRTSQQSTCINPPIFMPDALPVATLPIYPGLGQAQEYAELHTAVAWFIKQSILLMCECCNFRDCIDFSRQNCWWDPSARSLPAGKGKERKSIYIAPFCTKVHTKRSDMDLTVLPANNTMPAFPSWRSPDVTTTATEAAHIQLQLTAHLSTPKGWKAELA